MDTNILFTLFGIKFTWEGIGITVAALFSILSVVGAIINYFRQKKQIKIQYITNKRVNWINEIRRETAEYVTMMQIFCRKGKQFTQEEFYSVVSKQYTIRLYLNYAGVIDHVIEETMEKMVNYFNASQFDKAEEECATLVNHMQIYLKVEWDRVKTEASGKKYTNKINIKHTYEAYNKFLKNEEFIKETDVQKVADALKKKVNKK